jgi:hypothetical protein
LLETYGARSPEFVVHAHPDDIGVPASVVIGNGHDTWKKEGRRGVRIAQIDVEILGLDAPIVPERVFASEPECPSSMRA